MAHVETADYKGKERRNGSKLRLSFSDYIKVGSLVLVIVVAANSMKHDVIALEKAQKTNCEEIKELQQGAHERATQVIALQTDINNIKNIVANIEQKQHESNNLLYKIYGIIENGR